MAARRVKKVYIASNIGLSFQRELMKKCNSVEFVDAGSSGGKLKLLRNVSADVRAHAGVARPAVNYTILNF